MSRPISQCWINRAALGDEKAYETLVDAMDYNSWQVAYTLFPCECNPRCGIPSEEQLKALNLRVEEALAALRKERHKHARPVGTFEKFIFPVIKNMPPPTNLFDEVQPMQNE